MEIEPKLQLLTGEQLERSSSNRDPEACLDVKARGLWGGGLKCAFFDATIFNLRAHSKAPSSSTSGVYRRHELAKRRQYEQRVRDVEMSSFTPLIFSASGRFGQASTVTFKRLALRLSEKWSMPYASVMGWLRCRASFALLQSAIICLRGSRQHVGGRVTLLPHLAIAEGGILC